MDTTTQEATATFRFYGGLNRFLPNWRRQKATAYSFKMPVSVKHLIESQGIPHTEVALILANGEPVDFSYWPQPDDQISVYPAFATLDVSSLGRLRPSLSHPPRFLLDNHLGRLARYLRLLGFDTLYLNDRADDPELARIAQEEDRVLVTRDRGLLMRNQVVHGFCLHTRDTEEQVTAVLHRYDLYDEIRPWRRCMRCNGLLQSVAKEAIIDRLEPKTKKYFHEFQMCHDCRQIYWQGSHYHRLQAFLDRVLTTG